MNSVHLWSEYNKWRLIMAYAMKIEYIYLQSDTKPAGYLCICSNIWWLCKNNLSRVGCFAHLLFP